MNKHRIYVILGALLILSLVLVSVAAAAPPKLQKPRLLEPDNDEIITMENPCAPVVFNWSKVRNIDHYAFYIDYLDADELVPEWVPVYGDWTYTNSAVVNPTLYEGYVYRWYVGAVAYPNLESWSRTVNNFTVNTIVDTCPPT